jgi:acylphosphatase
MNERTRVHVHVAGRVQGVFFRDAARQRARQLGLSGWVRNTSDGRVEAVFEGDSGSVEEIIEWCGEGPPDASVSEVKSNYEEPRGDLSGFEIR